MNIILGGPPSSGSSLLSVLLRRHSKIYVEQETHLLSKAGLYVQWLRKREAIYKDRYVYLPSPGWHMLNGVILPSSPSVMQAKLQEMVTGAADLAAFIEMYFNELLQLTDSQIWGEKTPSNIFFFDRIQRVLPESIFLCPIRNPYDIVASLVHRGLSTYRACGLCLTQLYMVYIQLHHVDALLVKYEDLVSEPVQTMKEVFAYIGVSYEEVLSSATAQVRLPGWKYYEDGHIGKGSIDRFRSLDLHQQQDILYFTNHFTVNETFIDQLVPKLRSHNAEIGINDLTTFFGYEPPIVKLDNHTSFKIDRLQDRLRRLLKLHPSFIHYPIKKKQAH